MILTHHHSLLIALLVATFTLACGPSERRGTPTGFNGPSPIEGNDPQPGSNAAAATSVLRYMYLEPTLGFPFETQLCRCAFDDLDYASESECRDEEVPPATEVQALISCMASNADAMPTRTAEIDAALQVSDRLLADFRSCVDTALLSCDDTYTAIAACEATFTDDTQREMTELEPTIFDWIDAAFSALYDPDCAPR